MRRPLLGGRGPGCAPATGRPGPDRGVGTDQRQAVPEVASRPAVGARAGGGGRAAGAASSDVSVARAGLRQLGRRRGGTDQLPYAGVEAGAATGRPSGGAAVPRSAALVRDVAGDRGSAAERRAEDYGT